MNSKKFPNIYRLPDGKSTTSANRYVREWRKLYKPVCKALKVKCIGCDPDFLFTKGNQSFNLPVSVVRDINILIENEFSMFQE